MFSGHMRLALYGALPPKWPVRKPTHISFSSVVQPLCTTIDQCNHISTALATPRYAVRETCWQQLQ